MMRGRLLVRTFRVGAVDAAAVRRAALAVCFAVGALFGHGYAGVHADGQALQTYLREVCALWAAEGVRLSPGSCVLLYGGYAAGAFLLGFASVGAVLIPLLSGAFGFLSMYTVSCFVRVFGREGAVLAAAVLLVRMLFSLPCFLAMAEAAWPPSTELALLAFGRGRRSAPVLYGGRYFVVFGVCAAILAVGVCCERLVTPLLVRLALGAG